MDLPKFVSTRTKPAATVDRVEHMPDASPSLKLPLLIAPKESAHSAELSILSGTHDSLETAPTRHAESAFVVSVPFSNSNMRQGRLPVAQLDSGALSARQPCPPAGGISFYGESQAHHRMKVLENRVSTKKVNPIAAWPCMSNENKDRGQLVPVAARSPLALELEAFIRKEHRQLLLHSPGASRLQAIPIYREAWGCIINNFPEYAALLSLIRQEYDGVMEELQVQSEKALRMDKENRDMKGVHNMQLIQEREQMERHLSEKKIQLDAAIKANIAARQQYSLLEVQMEQKQYEFNQLQKELADSQERVRLLSMTVIDEGSKSAKYFTQLKEKKHENEQLSTLVHSLKATLSESEKQVDNLQRALSSAQERLVSESSLPPAGPDAPTKKSSMRKRSVSLSRTSSTAHTSAARESSPKSVVREHQPASPPKLSSPLGSAAAFDVPPEQHVSRSRRKSVDLVGEAQADSLRQMLFDLECKVEAYEHDNNVLRKQKAQLEDKVSGLRKETSRDVMTPRPDWNQVSGRLDGIVVTKDATSKIKLQELMTVVEGKLKKEFLANERAAYGKIIQDWIGNENISEFELIRRNKHMYPKGRGQHVPEYLRSGKLIRDRNLTKGDVEKILRRFWDARKIRMGGSVEDFWWQWLNSETGNSSSAVELAYNVIAVCERNLRDPDCSTFMRILQGDVSEQIIWDQANVLKQMNELFEERRIEGTQSKILRYELEKVLREVFPEKSIDNMRQLRFVLSMWSKGAQIIDFVALQSEDSDGNQSRFMEMLRDQYVDEISHFNLEVIEAIRETMVVGKTSTIAISSAVDAVSKLDPSLPEMYIFDRFAYACRMAVSELMISRDSHTVEGEAFLQRLKAGVLFKRCTPADLDDLFVPSDDGNEEERDDQAEEVGGDQMSAEASLS